MKCEVGSYLLRVESASARDVVEIAGYGKRRGNRLLGSGKAGRERFGPADLAAPIQVLESLVPI